MRGHSSPKVSSSETGRANLRAAMWAMACAREGPWAFSGASGSTCTDSRIEFRAGGSAGGAIAYDMLQRWSDSGDGGVSVACGRRGGPRKKVIVDRAQLVLAFFS